PHMKPCSYLFCFSAAVSRNLLATMFLLVMLPVAAAAQIGVWHLDDNANDASGNSIDGTLMNSPDFSTDRKEGTHSLIVNGSNEYVDLNNPSGFPSGTNARTISAWAKTNSISGTRTIFAYGSGTTGKAMLIGLSGTSLIGGAWSNDVTV